MPRVPVFRRVRCVSQRKGAPSPIRRGRESRNIEALEELWSIRCKGLEALDPTVREEGEEMVAVLSGEAKDGTRKAGDVLVG